MESRRSLSKIFLISLAPVDCFVTISAMKSAALESRMRSTSSISKSFLYCLKIAFFGSVIILPDFLPCQLLQFDDPGNPPYELGDESEFHEVLGDISGRPRFIWASGVFPGRGPREPDMFVGANPVRTDFIQSGRMPLRR